MISTNFSMLGTNSSMINTKFSIPKIVLVLVQSRSNHTNTKTIFGILNLVLIMLELVPSMLKLVQIILKLAYQQQYQYQYEIGTVQSEHKKKAIVGRTRIHSISIFVERRRNGQNVLEVSTHFDAFREAGFEAHVIIQGWTEFLLSFSTRNKHLEVCRL